MGFGGRFSKESPSIENLARTRRILRILVKRENHGKDLKVEKWESGNMGTTLIQKKTKRAGKRYAPEGAEVHSPAASEATPWGIAMDKQSALQG